MGDLISIKSKQKEVAKLEYPIWIKDIFPGAKWPVFSAVVQTAGVFFIRLRDSEDRIKLIDAKEVPMEVLIEQEHIQKLYESDRSFARYINRR